MKTKEFELPEVTIDYAKGPTISFSQFNMFSNCPLQWKLKYIDKHKEKAISIDLCFGKAMHETIQHYLTVMFKENVHKANDIDLSEYLLERIYHHYATDVVSNDNNHFSDPTELNEYFSHGVAILEELRKKRTKYFPTKNVSLVGIESALHQQVKGKIHFLAYIDVVLYNHDTKRFRVIDLKVSGRGWKKEKKDPSKTSQLLLYKEYFSKQFNVPFDNIDVEFMILKRTLYENAEFVQRRIQQFIPSSGSKTRKKVLAAVDKFIDFAFDSEGNPLSNKEYPAVTGPNGYNCKYCPFQLREDLCPKSKRHESANI